MLGGGELSGLCLGLMLLFFYSVLVDDARYRTCQSWLCEMIAGVLNGGKPFVQSDND